MARVGPQRHRKKKKYYYYKRHRHNNTNNISCASVVTIVVKLRTRESEVRISAEARDVSFLQSLSLLWGSSSLTFDGYRNSLFCVKLSEVKVTVHLVSRLTVGGDKLPQLSRPLRLCGSQKNNFTLSVITVNINISV